MLSRLKGECSKLGCFMTVIKNGKDKTARYTSNVFKFPQQERVYKRFEEMKKK